MSATSLEITGRDCFVWHKTRQHAWVSELKSRIVCFIPFITSYNHIPHITWSEWDTSYSDISTAFSQLCSLLPSLSHALMVCGLVRQTRRWSNPMTTKLQKTSTEMGEPAKGITIFKILHQSGIKMARRKPLLSHTTPRTWAERFSGPIRSLRNDISWAENQAQLLGEAWWW